MELSTSVAHAESDDDGSNQDIPINLKLNKPKSLMRALASILGKTALFSCLVEVVRMCGFEILNPIVLE